jgi:hypothetical protein
VSPRRDSRPFVASFGGPCAAECGDRIKPGEEVRYVADELMHVECADADLPPEVRNVDASLRRNSPACPSCWTVHAGECL